MTRWARVVLVGSACSSVACLGGTTTRETVRGRLAFVQGATATGTFGDEKSYSIANGDFRFAGKRQWGLGTFLTCDPSPNQAREAFVCQRHENMRERVLVVSVEGDRPKAVQIHDGDLRDSTRSSPAWVGDPPGAWLILQDFLYNVETGEKRTIKDVPGSYHAAFRAVSPDAETVVYQLSCMGGLAESEAEKRIEALCAEA